MDDVGVGVSVVVVVCCGACVIDEELVQEEKHSNAVYKGEQQCRIQGRACRVRGMFQYVRPIDLAQHDLAQLGRRVCGAVVPPAGVALK